MKQIFKLFTLAICLVAYSMTCDAQNSRVSREQMAEMLAKHIASELALDDATSEKFVNTYCMYQKDIWSLGPRPGHNKNTETEEEAEQVLKQRFEHSQNVLNIKQKYYLIYSEFLTQKQIQKVYEQERLMMSKTRKKTDRTR